MAHAHNTHTNGCGTKRSVVERFADHWAQTGGSRIEGLIAGYLLLDESDGVSAAQLSEELTLVAVRYRTISVCWFNAASFIGCANRANVPIISS